MKFIVAIFLFAVGYVLIKYCRWLVDNTGVKIWFLEVNIGRGSTYSAVKVAGVGVIAYGLWYLFH